MPLSTTSTAASGPQHAYGCAGALLRCDKGTLPCQLVIPARSVTIGGQPMANANDKDPLLNQLNFGVCSITQKPCLATIKPLQWLDVKRNIKVAGALALLDCSKLLCALGGLITFDHSGQLS